jgi:hypothetical protein
LENELSPEDEEVKEKNAETNDDDDGNADADIDGDEPSQASKTNITKGRTGETPPDSNIEVEQDYEVLDVLFEFLDLPDAYPIQCGYFFKIFQSLLIKMKQKMIVYLLCKRQGDIFYKLLDQLQHHSLAQMMIELLQIKISN